VRTLVRRVDSGDNYAVFQHTSVNVPGAAPARFTSITSAEKGEVSDNYRTDTAFVTSINADGTITESMKHQVRVPLSSALEGLTPEQMFDRMVQDKASGKVPDYLPREVGLAPTR
jgi:hypothetical protein